jgi:methionyl-tRNA formyltransferase
MTTLKIIFAGTPEFAVPALAALIDAGHDIVTVLTQPDRPAGRGMKLKASPIKSLALKHQIPVLQPETLKDLAVQLLIAELHADVMVVAAYGLIIPTPVLQLPKLGCFNIHASLLPRWRGAAPIQRSILAGDTETGVTIMEVVPALDAGGMISRASLQITERDTAQSLHDGLSHLGGALMVEAMQTLMLKGKLESTPQDESLVTYANKLQKVEAQLDWSESALVISRQVRAFNPFPVTHTKLNGELCRLWMATEYKGRATASPNAGEVVDIEDSIVVACGEGLLSIEELQMPGGKRLLADDFIRGHAIKVGHKFGH